MGRRQALQRVWVWGQCTVSFSCHGHCLCGSLAKLSTRELPMEASLSQPCSMLSLLACHWGRQHQIFLHLSEHRQQPTPFFR
uniref:Uncharacterized protein n=1 Tax=Rhizophora mucronata TaxID=61149 RepID=A0A2P2K8T1_RHIMU